MKAILYDPEKHFVKEMSIEKIADILNTKVNSIYSRLSRQANYVKTYNLYVFREIDKKFLQEIYRKTQYDNEQWILSAHSEKYECSTRGRVRKIYKTKKVISIPYYKRNKLDQYVKINQKEMKLSRFVKSAFERRILEENENVVHLDGIKNNNRLENLEIMDKEQLGKRTGPISRSQVIVKMDIVTGEILDEYRSIREAAKQNFMSHDTINSAFRRGTDIAGGFKWRKGEWDFEEITIN